MPRRDFRNARCLVTGASTGLGQALASELTKRGARVVMVARSADRLNQAAATLVANGAAPDAVLPIAADVTSSDDRLRIMDFVADKFLGVLDLAINNAGIGAYGRFESHDESITRRLFEVNVFALMEMCRAVLPSLRSGQDAALVNIGSIVARRGLPGRSEYSASKFAVAGFTEALRAEWSCDKIRVHLINPGFTTTEFEKNLVADTSVYATTGRRTMSAESVARAILGAVTKGQNEITLSRQGRLLLGFNRIAPWFVNWGLYHWTRRLYTTHENPTTTLRHSPKPIKVTPKASGD